MPDYIILPPGEPAAAQETSDPQPSKEDRAREIVSTAGHDIRNSAWATLGVSIVAYLVFLAVCRQYGWLPVLFKWPSGILVGNLLASALWAVPTFWHMHHKMVLQERRHHLALLHLHNANIQLVTELHERHSAQVQQLGKEHQNALEEIRQRLPSGV